MARPRSEEAHRKVLLAALDLFGERGIDAASMDAIARASGVSKATIYNHWEDKEGLLLEVLDLVHGLDRERREIDTGDLEGDLRNVLSNRPPDEFEQQRIRITPTLIAYSAVHSEFGLAWRRRVTEPARLCLTQIIERAKRRRTLDGSLDTDEAIAMLLGPMLYVHIFSSQSEWKNRDLGPVVAEAFVRAFGRAKRRGSGRLKGQ